MPLDTTEKPRIDRPDSPVALPSDSKELLETALNLIEQCRTSAPMRAAYCRMLYALSETGRSEGGRSLINMLYSHLDRLAPHLFSPSELRFTIDFENEYPPNIIAQGHRAAKILTRDWERSNTDIRFGIGVFEALRYGCHILKQWVQEEGPEHRPVHYSQLVKPWMFGVYREDLNDLNRQPVMCETMLLSLPEVWRRIWHMPDAVKLFGRIKVHAQRGQAGDEYSSFFHQILSTSQLNTSGNTGLTRPVPGGIVQLNRDPNYLVMGPEVAVDLVRMHELWIWNGKRRDTIQVIEPDILLSPGPYFKLSNLLISGDTDSELHPYTLIQPNMVDGYIWGRSELTDLINPQDWLSTTADDIKRLFGLQIDKILSFMGFDGITDETYDQMREAGFFNGPMGSTVNDLTPQFPQQAMPLMQLIMELIDRLGGFDNLLAGRGEPGVRAGVHADTLMKTASPRLRDRSLLLERQCAQAADLWLSVLEAKDGKTYWTDGKTPELMEETKFHLADLPDDRRVAVDSHSSSVIFQDDHVQLISWAAKMGFIDGEDSVEMLPFPEKDHLIQKIRERKAQNDALMKQLLQKDPEALEKILIHQRGGKR